MTELTYNCFFKLNDLVKEQQIYAICRLIIYICQFQFSLLGALLVIVLLH